MSNELRSRVVARLSGDDSVHRDRLVRAALDHAAAQPLSSFVDRDALVALAKKAATEANVTELLTMHGRPAFERQKLRSARLGETLGELMAPDTEARLVRLLDGAKLPDARWAKGVVDPKLVNKLVSPVVQKTLLSFAKRMPIPGMNDQATGAANALGGALLGGLGGLAGGAGRLFDVGKSVVGGLSAEVEKKIQAVARDFAETASDEFRMGMVKRLESDEGRAIVRELVLTAHARLRGVAVADVLAEADALPAAEVDGLVAATVAHNGLRAAVADVLRAEIDAALAAEASTTLGALLDRVGVRREAEAVLLTKIDAHVRALAGTEAFASFVDGLLAD